MEVRKINADIPTTEPIEITAGDSLAWDREDLDDYPASDGWSLSYSIAGPQKITLLTTPDEDHYHIRADAVTTRTWAAGVYWWDAYVTKTTERYKVDWGTLKILPNLQEAATGYDGRTDAEKELAGWKTLLYQLSQHKSSTITHGGKTYTEKDLDKVRAARDDAQARVNTEKAKERRAQGKGTGRKIMMRIVSPS